MARGWEIKSVEAQQADAGDKATNNRPRLTAEGAARARDHETLRLARTRVLQQLEATQNPNHRQLLQDSLADLEEKLKRLGD